MIRLLNSFIISCLSLLLFPGISQTAKAQAPVAHLSTGDMQGEVLLLGGLNGWSYLKGTHPVPGNVPSDSAGWIGLDSSFEYQDIHDGKEYLATWFRLRFTADQGAIEKMKFLTFYHRQIVYVYLNDSLVFVSGIPDSNSILRHMPLGLGSYMIPFNFQEGRIYDLKLFAVNHLPQPLFRTKEQRWPLSALGAFLSNAEIKRYQLQLEVNNLVSGGILMLSILFWLIFFLNKREKATGLIAVCVSLLFVGQAVNTGSILSRWIPHFQIEGLVSQVFIGAWIAFIPLLLNYLFKQRIHWFSFIFIAYACIVSCGVVLFGIPFSALFITPIVAAVSTFYITATSWKRISGGLWVVVAGLIITVILIGLYVVSQFFEWNISAEWVITLICMMLIAFPVSLLVYTAVRQKNLLEETRAKALENLQLTQAKLKSEEENKRILAAQNIVLEREVEKRTAELKDSLEHLRATQSQLIQSEKMASLGELTAGIAHEIQNPLNFVNNFSEVSSELLDEMQEELNRGEVEEARAIAADIRQNLAKILYHGQRADGIVKSMLQHSRSSTGQKELTNLNLLADEYLRLAYHGLRAANKSFSAKYEILPDPALPAVAVVPQDMGRVLLNLINNAFYAAFEKGKTAGASFVPTVQVRTRKLDHAVELVVSDNGVGIPDALLEKIFQPFFTTKPTGKGTGLGLSLSYDIVKAHGGELKVDSREGEGSSFIIVLPA